MLCRALVEQVRYEHMPDEYKISMYYYSIAEDPILVLQTIRDHHTVSPTTELTNVGRDKRATKNLPTCNVDQPLKPSCILFGQNISVIVHILKLQSFNPPVSKFGIFERRQTSFLTIPYRTSFRPSI